MKTLVTSNTDMMENCARNFKLKYHSSVLLDTLEFCDEAKACLQRYGFSPDFWTTFSIHHATSLDNKVNAPLIEVKSLEAVEQYLNRSTRLMHVENSDLKRLAHVSRFNVRLMSTSGRIALRTSEEVKINDTFVRIDEEFFGEIDEIFEIEDEEIFLLVVKKCEKIRVTKDDGETVVMPMNTFPFVRTEEYIVRELNRNIFIQKGSYCLLEYIGDSNAYECLSFRPNEWFSF